MKGDKITPINFTITGTIYPFDLMISIDEAEDVLFKRLKKGGIEDSEWEGVKMSITTTARTIMFPGNQTLIRLKSPLSPGIVAHEAFHAAVYILDRVGMKLQIETSDEAYAYLLNYIVDEIYKGAKK